MLKTNEDIALQIKSRNFTNVFWRGASSCLPPYKRLFSPVTLFQGILSSRVDGYSLLFFKSWKKTVDQNSYLAPRMTEIKQK